MPQKFDDVPSPLLTFPPPDEDGLSVVRFRPEKGDDGQFQVLRLWRILLMNPSERPARVKIEAVRIGGSPNLIRPRERSSVVFAEGAGDPDVPTQGDVVVIESGDTFRIEIVAHPVLISPNEGLVEIWRPAGSGALCAKAVCEVLPDLFPIPGRPHARR